MFSKLFRIERGRVWKRIRHLAVDFKIVPVLARCPRVPYKEVSINVCAQKFLQGYSNETQIEEPVVKYKAK